MKNTPILIDAGPLIALFDRDDAYHEKAIQTLQENPSPLISTWPVLTEVMHMLDFNSKTQMDFLRWVENGALQIAQLEKEDLLEISRLMQKYADQPMDFADASLVCLAERESLNTVISFDRDFKIYRVNKKPFKIL